MAQDLETPASGLGKTIASGPFGVSLNAYAIKLKTIAVLDNKAVKTTFAAETAPDANVNVARFEPNSRHVSCDAENQRAKRWHPPQLAHPCDQNRCKAVWRYLR